MLILFSFLDTIVPQTVLEEDSDEPPSYFSGFYVSQQDIVLLKV